jgi:hypothetical protein
LVDCRLSHGGEVVMLLGCVGHCQAVKHHATRWLKELRRLTRSWWLFPALIATLVVAAYFFKLAPLSDGHLSQSNEDWARFGEYVGGVFGILAFVGVLITIDLQRRQLRELHAQMSQLSKQATVDELHRICRDLASNIDAALNRPLIVSAVTGLALNTHALQPPTMQNILRLVEDVHLQDEAAEHASIPEAQHGASIKLAADLAMPQLELLAKCIQDSYIFGGDTVAIIVAYYRERYAEVVRAMQVLGYKLESSDFWLKNIGGGAAIRKSVP